MKTKYQVEYYREDFVECSALVYAVYTSNLTEVKKILDLESVDQQDLRGRSAVEWSLEISINSNRPKESKQVLDLILSKKPNPFLNTNAVNGCFEYIYKGYKSEITELLLKLYDTNNLLSVNQKINLATSALQSGNFEAYRLLIQAWDLKDFKPNSYETTDLHKACELGSIIATEAALNLISNVNLLNELGQTPLDLVQITKKGNSDEKNKIQAVLISKGGKNNYLNVTDYIEIPIYLKMNNSITKSLMNIKHPSLAFIKTVFTSSESKALDTIKNETNFDQKDLLGATALYWSIYKHCLQGNNNTIVEALIEKGAQASVKHQYMGTIQDLITHFKCTDLTKKYKNVSC